MAVTVLTNNSYLRIGIKELMRNSNLVDDVIVLDLDSFNSLYELIGELEVLRLPKNKRLTYVGSKSIIFRLMDKLNPIPVSESLLRIKNDISAIKLSTFKELKEMVNQYHQLSLLTVRERQCLHALCQEENILRSAKLTNMTEKTFYTMVRNVTSKLNLQGLFQLRVFLSKEF